MQHLSPPVTPKVPPQLVACGDRDVYRITSSALEVFELAEELPPPQIRGSRIARQTAEILLDEPRNVFSPAKKSALVIAKAGVFRYELGRAGARRYGPIETKEPFWAWPDPRRTGSFRVHAAGSQKVEDYTLDGVESLESDSPKAPAKLVPRAVALPEFDTRLFTVLTNGSPLYSTPKGLVRGNESRNVPFSEPSGPATVLFADSSADRHWAADASGHLALWDRKREGSPIATASVPGVVIDAAQESERVAVLSMELAGQSYLPTVTIFSNGTEQARLRIGPNIGARAQPKLDVCLVPGRPWVAVGGTLWMQLLDWESRRLLSEW